MTKADLIAVIEKQANLSPKQAEKVVNITFDSMIQALFDDDRIEISGFGSFANQKLQGLRRKKSKDRKYC
jgi:integration host factor subunit beta